MKYIKLLLIPIFMLNISNHCLAQIDVFGTTAKYEYTFQEDSTDVGSKKTEEMILMVNSRKSFFTSNSKVILDSLKNQDLSISEFLAIKKCFGPYKTRVLF